MKNTANRGVICAHWMWLGLAILIWLSGRAQAREDKFDVLRTKTKVYTNVTVTSMSKTEIYIIHSAGICNLKVIELPPETLQQLHHSAAPPVAGTQHASLQVNASEPASSKQEDQIPTTGTTQAPPPGIGQLNAQLSSELTKLRSVGVTFILIFLVVCLAMYLFFCYCFSLICRKAGHEPGILIWLPVLQMFPLLRAAGMSPLWILAFFVPVLNLIAHVMWCINITKAREKSMLIAVLLMFPITNLFALLYLAFSDGTAPRDEPVRPAPLVLEAK